MNQVHDGISKPTACRNNVLWTRLRCGRFAVVALAAGICGWAGSSTVYGPEKFVRKTAAPTTETRTFSATPGNDYQLLITSNNVSSAVVTLNGVRLAGPNDFSHRLDVITRQVRLLETNRLQVELRGAPGEYLTIEITGSDAGRRLLTIDPKEGRQGQQNLPVTITGQFTGFAPATTEVSFGSGVATGAVHINGAGSLTVPISIAANAVPGPRTVTVKNGATTATLTNGFTVLLAANRPPVANAGRDQTVAIGQTVTLDGSGSSDPDGNPLTFAWSFTSIPAGSAATLSNASAVRPTFTADKAGAYVVRLMVSDGSLESGPSTVTVSTSNSPPVANAGPNQTVAVGATVQLSGRASSDVDGDALTYAWSFVSRPAGSAAALSNPAIVNPTFVADKPGSYVIQLIVNDGKASSAPSSTTVSTQNSPPVANAGPDQTVTTGSAVQLNGGGSSDLDGNPLTYAWSFLSRPAGSAAALSNAAAVNPAFTADKPGSYVVQLIVNDGQVNSAADSVVVTTANSPPVANAGPDQTVTVGATVTLSGAASTDPDMDTLTYAWSLTSRPVGSTAALSNSVSVSTSFVADKAGSYVVQLIVNDGRATSAPDTVVVTTSNSAPVANAGPDQVVARGSLVGLDGSASSDADGDTLTYSWSLLSQPIGSSAVLSNPAISNPAFTADVAGTYVAQLIVNDGKVNSAPDTVTVTTSNSAPTANAGSEQTVTAGSTVQLSGAQSSDPDGDPLTYLWTFTTRPDGCAAAISNPTSVAPSFVADVAGDYWLQLVVNDGKVSSTPASVRIRAVPAGLNLYGFPASVGMGLQSGTYIARLGSSSHGGVVIRISTGDASRLLVAADNVTPGSPSIDIFVANGRTDAEFWIQGVEGATAGSTSITASTTGFGSATGSVSVVTPVIEIRGLNGTPVSSSAANIAFYVTVGTPNSSNTMLGISQPVRAGSSVTVTITNSLNTVGQLVTAAGAGQSRTIVLAGGSYRSPTGAANGGIEFDPLAAGSTVVTAAAPGFTTVPTGSRTVTVVP